MTNEAITSPNELMAVIYAVIPEWDRNLVEDVVISFGSDGEPFSANDFRHLLPEAAHRHIGAVLNSMSARRPAAIVPVGEVRSTAASTHGKAGQGLAPGRGGWC